MRREQTKRVGEKVHAALAEVAVREALSRIEPAFLVFSLEDSSSDNVLFSEDLAVSRLQRGCREARQIQGFFAAYGGLVFPAA